MSKPTSKFIDDFIIDYCKSLENEDRDIKYIEKYLKAISTNFFTIVVFYKDKYLMSIDLRLVK